MPKQTKPGTQDRMKAGVRTASSAAAAEAMNKLSNHDTTGFIGFGAFARDPPSTQQQHHTSANNSHLLDFYAGPDMELATALKHVLKKDKSTRIRTLQQLSELLSSDAKSPSTIRNLLPHWSYDFERLLNDNDKRVRELATSVMATIVDRVPKAACKQAKRFFHLLLFSVSDPVDSVAAAAKRAIAAMEAFASANADVGEGNLYVTCADEILLQCQHRIHFAPVQGKQAKVDEIEASERLQRMQSTGLLTLKQLVVHIREDADLQRVGAVATPWSIVKILRQDTVMKLLFNKNPLVRKAAYVAHSGFLSCAPWLALVDPTADPSTDLVVAAKRRLSDSNLKLADGQLLCAKYIKSVHKVLAETDRAVMAQMCVFVIDVFQAFKSFVWNNLDYKKAYFPALWRVFDEGGRGTGGHFYGNCLALMSLMNTEVWSGFDVEAGPAGLFDSWFGHSWNGLHSKKLGPHSYPALLNGHLDCLAFGFKWTHLHEPSLDATHSQNLIDALERRLCECVQYLLAEDLRSRVEHRVVYESLSRVLRQISAHTDNHTPKVWDKIVDSMLRQPDTDLIDRAGIARGSTLLLELFRLRDPSNTSHKDHLVSLICSFMSQHVEDSFSESNVGGFPPYAVSALTKVADETSIDIRVLCGQNGADGQGQFLDTIVSAWVCPALSGAETAAAATQDLMSLIVRLLSAQDETNNETVQCHNIVARILDEYPGIGYPEILTGLVDLIRAAIEQVGAAESATWFKSPEIESLTMKIVEDKAPELNEHRHVRVEVLKVFAEVDLLASAGASIMTCLVRGAEQLTQLVDDCIAETPEAHMRLDECDPNIALALDLLSVGQPLTRVEFLGDDLVATCIKQVVLVASMGSIDEEFRAACSTCAAAWRSSLVAPRVCLEVVDWVSSWLRGVHAKQAHATLAAQDLARMLQWSVDARGVSCLETCCFFDDAFWANARTGVSTMQLTILVLCDVIESTSFAEVFGLDKNHPQCENTRLKCFWQALVACEQTIELHHDTLLAPKREYLLAQLGTWVCENDKTATQVLEHVFEHALGDIFKRDWMNTKLAGGQTSVELLSNAARDALARVDLSYASFLMAAVVPELEEVMWDVNSALDTRVQAGRVLGLVCREATSRNRQVEDPNTNQLADKISKLTTKSFGEIIRLCNINQDAQVLRVARETLAAHKQSLVDDAAPPGVPVLDKDEPVESTQASKATRVEMTGVALQDAPFRAGDHVMYVQKASNKLVAGTIQKVHHDDGDEYFTVKLATGSEVQTVRVRLYPVLSKNTKVVYSRNDVTCGATVMQAHFDDIERGVYYTVHLDTDGGREVQTTMERLALQPSPSPRQAEPSAVTPGSKPTSIQELHHLLSLARRAGDHKESLRLMKMIPELTPKPVDDDQVKAEAKQKAKEQALVAQQRLESAKRKVLSQRKNAPVNDVDAVVDDADVGEVYGTHASDAQQQPGGASPLRSPDDLAKLDQWLVCYCAMCDVLTSLEGELRETHAQELLGLVIVLPAVVPLAGIAASSRLGDVVVDVLYDKLKASMLDLVLVVTTCVDTQAILLQDLDGDLETGGPILVARKYIQGILMMCVRVGFSAETLSGDQFPDVRLCLKFSNIGKCCKVMHLLNSQADNGFWHQASYFQVSLLNACCERFLELHDLPKDVLNTPWRVASVESLLTMLAPVLNKVNPKYMLAEPTEKGEGDNKSVFRQLCGALNDTDPVVSVNVFKGLLRCSESTLFNRIVSPLSLAKLDEELPTEGEDVAALGRKNVKQDVKRDEDQATTRGAERIPSEIRTILEDFALDGHEAMGRPASVLSAFLSWLVVLRELKLTKVISPVAKHEMASYLHNTGLASAVLVAACYILDGEVDVRGDSAGPGEAESARDMFSVNTDAFAPRHMAHFFESHLKSGGFEYLEMNSRQFTIDSLHGLAEYVVFHTVQALPALVRDWWGSLTRMEADTVSRYVTDNVTGRLLAEEIEELQAATDAGAWDEDEMKVKGSSTARTVTALYSKEDCVLEMVINLPASYPLKLVEVECTKRLGVREDRWRRWVLQIVTLLKTQDGSILDAVQLWKKNVDKEFEGVEPCPICYSVLHVNDQTLPRLDCKTCHNTFHAKCLVKWFQSSHKNECPLCRQPFN